MPRFFFHLHNDLDVADEEGTEFPDLAAARDYARHQVRVTFAETVRDTGRVVLSHRLDIEDQDGTVLDSIRFGDAVTVKE